MTRKKVKLQYIINQSSRRPTYNKRKSSLLKTVNEISILCGIEEFVVVYGENNVEPDVWPPGPRIQNVLQKFRGLSKLERNKRAEDLEGYLKKRIEKSHEQLRKQILENKKKKFTNVIDKALINLHNNTDLVNINELNDMKDELNDLTKFIDSNINEVEKKLESMNLEAEEHVVNEGDMQARVHGLDIQNDYQYLPWDNFVLSYHDYNMDTDSL
ncbi:unnamed protein product [Vicia faba]|uniref:MADS-box domain-containing protein n=1 Tax=Vicia faba TaxID=3906 RepID=A0AAV0ZIY3_VICFA|nr:unnamed protein product [Vicia faba]